MRPPPQDITDRARAERLAVIHGQLLRRMRPVCANMPEDLFHELIDAMAATQLKYEMHEGTISASNS